MSLYVDHFYVCLFLSHIIDIYVYIILYFLFFFFTRYNWNCLPLKIPSSLFKISRQHRGCTMLETPTSLSINMHDNTILNVFFKIDNRL